MTASPPEDAGSSAAGALTGDSDAALSSPPDSSMAVCMGAAGVETAAGAGLAGFGATCRAGAFFFFTALAFGAAFFTFFFAALAGRVALALAFFFFGAAFLAFTAL